MSINGTQSLGLEKGTIEFKNYFKQILVPSKVYPDFECNLKSAESFEGFYSKNYHDHVPCNFAYTHVFVLMVNLLSQQLFLEAKMLLINLSKQF